MELEKNFRQVFEFKGLTSKVFESQQVTRAIPFARDFGSGLPLLHPVTQKRVPGAPARSRPLNASDYVVKER